MQVDRGVFLELTALLAAAATSAACTRPPPDAGIPGNAVSAGSAAGVSPAAPSALTIPAAAPPSFDSGDGACSNDVGSLAACARIGPSCEGLAEECRSIGGSLRPRVAAAFADCFARARPPKCRDAKLGACMRAAVESACIEPDALVRCTRIMAACASAGRTPKYTLDRCARVLSATPPDADGDWSAVDEERLGPSTAEGCSLEAVLPYQPYGFSWR